MMEQAGLSSSDDWAGDDGISKADLDGLFNISDISRLRSGPRDRDVKLAL